MHYILPGEHYSGYKLETQSIVYDTLAEDVLNGIIQMIYIDNINRTIYSHAGISNVWFNNKKYKSLEEINHLNSILDLGNFRFTGFDMTGNDPRNGPLWIRPESLLFNMYQDEEGEWKQIVGHTHSLKPIEQDNLIVIDTMPKYYIVQELDEYGKLIHQNIVQNEDYV